MLQKISSPNWVAERAKCDLEFVFTALNDIVKRDVEEISKVEPEKRHAFTFEFQDVSDLSVRRFEITRHDNSVPFRRKTSVFFTQLDTGIEIGSANDEKFQVIAEWDEQKASCRLTVDGVTLEPWQVSQKALASFFFDG